MSCPNQSCHKFTEAEIRTLFQKFDTNSDKVIDIEEFELLLTEVQGKAPTKGDAAAIFKKVDENGDGKISYLELKTAFLQKKA